MSNLWKYCNAPLNLVKPPLFSFLHFRPSRIYWKFCTLCELFQLFVSFLLGSFFCCFLCGLLPKKPLEMFKLFLAFFFLLKLKRGRGPEAGGAGTQIQYFRFHR